MTITTRDGLIAAQAGAQRIRIFKTGVRTSVALFHFSTIDLAGDPGAGTLAGTSTAAGVVPDDSTTGCPPVNSFSGSNKGYVTRFEVSSPAASRVMLADILFKAGAYSFNAAVTLSAQPSYSARIPGADYKGTEIWLETVTAFTGNITVAVTYTNQDGTTGHTTGTYAPAVAPTVGRMFRMPLQAGDTGVQKIESVTGTVATVGTFNVLVIRKICEARVKLGNDLVIQGPDLTGMPQIFDTSALQIFVNADSTSTSTPEVVLDIANG